MGDVENPTEDCIEDDGDDNMGGIRNLMVALSCLVVAMLIVMIIGIFKGEEHL